MEQTEDGHVLKKIDGLSDRISLFKVARFHVTLLRMGGLMVFGRGRFWIIIKKILSIYAHACYFSITSMYACSVVRGIIQDSNEVTTVAEFIGLAGAHLRFVILYIKRDKLINILKDCQILWGGFDESEKIIISKFIKKSTALSLLYVSCCLSQCVFYVMVSQLSNNSLQFNNNSQIHRSLPYPYYADVQSSPWYELATMQQTMSFTNISFTSAGVDIAAPFFIFMACGYIKSLSHRIDRLTSLENSKIRQDETWSMEKEIAACVIFHQKIVEFCKDVQDLIDLLFLTQLLSTSYVASLLGLRLIRDEVGKFKSLPVIILLVTQLFLCQWPPDMLISQNESLARSIYFVPLSGYTDKRLLQLIQIFMVRSQHSIRFTAGGFVNLSLECFGSMITSAVSFFTVLRSIK